MALRDILTAAGLKDEQIKEIENEAIAEATRLNTEAKETLLKAEQEHTRLKDWWENDAALQLNGVYSDRDAAKAEAAFYKAQAESAKDSGFIPKDAPGFQTSNNPSNPNPGQPRDTNTGRFVTGANEVPGSPKYMTQQEADARYLNAISGAISITTEHERLFGEPLPVPVMELVTEATNRSGMGRSVSARQVWEEKYKVGDRRAAIEADRQKAHDDSIRKDEREKNEREFAERGGSNPNLRSGQTSNFANLAVKERSTKDVPNWQKSPRDRKIADREFARQVMANSRVQ